MACAKLDMAPPFVRVCGFDKPGAPPMAPPKAHCDAPPPIAYSQRLVPKLVASKQLTQLAVL
jgi:hypothetical protein